MSAPPAFHGSRLWRCQAEMLGRQLRGQAARKKQGALILPILEQGMIQPKTEKKRAGKKRKAMREARADPRKGHEDGGTGVERHRVREQACTYSLATGCFPDSSEEMQVAPRLRPAQLPDAGDDGANDAHACRLSLELDQKPATRARRFPDTDGTWSRSWGGKTMKLSLADLVIGRLNVGEGLAPAVRAPRQADGTRDAGLDVLVTVAGTDPAAWSDMPSLPGVEWGVRPLLTAATGELDGHDVGRGRPFFLDTGTCDGRHARTRQHSDLLTAQIATREAQRDRCATGEPTGEPCIEPV